MSYAWQNWQTNRQTDRQTDRQMKGQSEIAYLPKFANRKWQDYVYIQCEYKSTKQKIKHLLREENKVKENKIS